ncbi:hypothetical protein E2C01_069579 [Portunus trituberculatus]|uniref:Uncharacterized protein n=1 Tax=Portunus trituberculatus TaxID=210409 RepID=A0A5B7HZ90_PORTR|nr:hypothetical protein [Portunus trituberculatus]
MVDQVDAPRLVLHSFFSPLLLLFLSPLSSSSSSSSSTSTRLLPRNHFYQTPTLPSLSQTSSVPPTAHQKVVPPPSLMVTVGLTPRPGLGSK